MIPELCSQLKDVCRAKGIGCAGTRGAHRILVSWSPAPGREGDSGLFQV